MKSLAAYALKLLAALTACVVFTTGCAHTNAIRLKAVDATSQKPLADVLTVWRQDSAYNLLTGRRHETGPTNLPPSVSDGLIVIPDANPKMVSRLVFSKTGYESAYGIYNADSGALKIGQGIDPRIPGPRFVLNPPYTNAAQMNGLFVVPMQRR